MHIDSEVDPACSPVGTRGTSLLAKVPYLAVYTIYLIQHWSQEGAELYVNFPLAFMTFYFDTAANYIGGVCQIIRQPLFGPYWPHRHQTFFFVLSFLYQRLRIRNLFYIQKVDECKCV